MELVSAIFESSQNNKRNDLMFVAQQQVFWTQMGDCLEIYHMRWGTKLSVHLAGRAFRKSATEKGACFSDFTSLLRQVAASIFERPAFSLAASLLLEYRC